MDIYKQLATEIFGVDYDSVTDAQRKYAKTLNYVYAYGGNGYVLTDSMKSSIEDALKLKNK